MFRIVIVQLYGSCIYKLLIFLYIINLKLVCKVTVFIETVSCVYFVHIRPSFFSPYSYPLLVASLPCFLVIHMCMLMCKCIPQKRKCPVFGAISSHQTPVCVCVCVSVCVCVLFSLCIPLLTGIWVIP